MAPSCASSVPPLIGDYPRCRAAAWQAAPTLPLGLSVAAASLSTEASLPLDMPGGREGLEGDTDAQGSARRRSGLAHTSTRRVATRDWQPCFHDREIKYISQERGRKCPQPTRPC